MEAIAARGDIVSTDGAMIELCFRESMIERHGPPVYGHPVSGRFTRWAIPIPIRKRSNAPTPWP